MGLEVEVVTPDPADVAAMVARHGPNLFHKDPALRRLCCHVRKVAPLDRPVRGRGLGDRAAARAAGRHAPTPPKAELDAAHGDIVKLNPLADWSRDQVWAYVRGQSAAGEPLYEQGYTSIGCALHRPTRPGEDERRPLVVEADSDRERGLHARLAGGAAASPGDRFSAALQRLRADVHVRARETAMAADLGPAGGACGVRVPGAAGGDRPAGGGDRRARRGGGQGRGAAGGRGRGDRDRQGPEAALDRLEATRGDVRRRGYRGPADLTGAVLCVASAAEPGVRDAIAADARTAGVLVNVMDDVPNCDFAAPAIVRRGDLLIAVGTGGRAPPRPAASAPSCPSGSAPLDRAGRRGRPGPRRHPPRPPRLRGPLLPLEGRLDLDELERLIAHRPVRPGRHPPPRPPAGRPPGWQPRPPWRLACGQPEAADPGLGYAPPPGDPPPAGAGQARPEQGAPGGVSGIVYLVGAGLGTRGC